MDDTKFLTDRLAFWIGMKSLVMEKVVISTKTLKDELNKTKRYFENSRSIDRNNKLTILKLNRLNRLTLD